MDAIAPSMILCGLAIASGTTIITIPAGMLWMGWITLSASNAIASGGGQVSGSARVSVVGAGANPPPGDYIRLDLTAPASILAAIGTGANSSINAPLIVAAPTGQAVTLVLNTSSTTAQSASACGILRCQTG